MQAPKLTQLQVNSLVPSDGTIIYNIDIDDFQVRDEGVWKVLAFSESGDLQDLQSVLDEGNISTTGFFIVNPSPFTTDIVVGNGEINFNFDENIYSYVSEAGQNITAYSTLGDVTSTYLQFSNPAYSATYSDYQWEIYNNTSYSGFSFYVDPTFTDSSRILAPMGQMEQYLPIKIDGAYADAYGQVTTTYSEDLVLTGSDSIEHNLGNVYNFVQVYNTSTGENITAGLVITATGGNTLTITGGTGLSVRVLVKP